MPTLRADENRYRLYADGAERPLVRRIPGHRWSAAQHCWLLPRQPAVIRALDVVFAGAWEWEEDLEVDVAEARERLLPPPAHEATVHLDGNRLAVECRIDDKELVKLVPGYRWAPDVRRWFVDALPLAFDVLREAFGDRLIVDQDVVPYIELRRGDEQRQVELAARSMPAGPATRAIEPSRPPADPSSAAPPVGDDTLDLARQVSKLADAIERIEAKLDRLLVDGATPPAGEAAPFEAVPSHANHDHPPVPGHEEWRSLVTRADSDPAGALQEANLRLQTADPDAAQELRAAAGIAAGRCGQHEHALRHLRNALDGPEPLPPDLAALAAREYERAVFALINAECGPEQPVSDARSFRQALIAEVVNDAGFRAEAIGSADARARLEFLVKDPVLRRVAPAVADYCRLAHLIGSVRSGMWMAHERVADVLREDSLGDEAFATGLVLYANVLMDAPAATDWVGRWPELEENVLATEAGWFVTNAIERLPRAGRDLAAPAALALLACIAPGRAEQATVEQRRALLDLIRPGEGWREFAEFLAAFRLAADGKRLNPRQFHGYVSTLARIRLERSARHIEQVLYNGEGGPGSLVRAIADEAYLPALANGVTDPASEVVQLLDLLEHGSRPDNLLNAVADLVEDGEGLPGAGMFTRAQRLQVYRRALDASVRAGHDEDSRRAFFRLVRALSDEPSSVPLLALCGEHLQGFRPLRVPALIVQIEAMLDDGAPVEAILDLVEPVLTGRKEPGGTEIIEAELAALCEVYPQHRETITAFLRSSGTTGLDQEAPRFDGHRVLVVGGHQRLCAKAQPLIEAQGVEVDWLGADEAKQGGRLPALAGGACELVVVNTAYISHAASRRAFDAANAAGKRLIQQNLNGVGSVVGVVQHELERLEREARKGAARKPAKTRGKAKLLRP